MGKRFDAIIGELVNTALAGREGCDESRVRLAVGFVLRQHARLPDHLRVPMRALVCLFAFHALLAGGRRFARQPPASRRRRLEAWRNSRLSPLRDFVRFHEALAIIAAFDEPPPDRRPG